MPGELAKHAISEGTKSVTKVSHAHLCDTRVSNFVYSSRVRVPSRFVSYVSLFFSPLYCTTVLYFPTRFMDYLSSPSLPNVSMGCIHLKPSCSQTCTHGRYRYRLGLLVPVRLLSESPVYLVGAFVHPFVTKSLGFLSNVNIVVRFAPTTCCHVPFILPVVLFTFHERSNPGTN